MPGKQSAVEPLLGREAAQEQYVVDPEVAEVVHVDASPALARTEETRQPSQFGVGRRFLETPAHIRRRRRQRPPAKGGGPELPKVILLPVEGDLNRLVEVGETGVPRDLETPPDARFDVAQGHFEFIVDRHYSFPHEKWRRLVNFEKRWKPGWRPKEIRHADRCGATARFPLMSNHREHRLI